MRKIKFSLEQLHDVLTSHLEAVGVISPTEFVTIPELLLDKKGLVNVCVHKAVKDTEELPWL
jgi:hypothetical protein